MSRPGSSHDAAARSDDGAPHTAGTPGDGAWKALTRVSSADAERAFGAVLETVERDEAVLITSQNAPRAVVMSVRRYEALRRTAEPELDLLTAEFDALLAGMQDPAAQSAMHAAFNASPEELGEAAVEAARRHRA